MGKELTNHQSDGFGVPENAGGQFIRGQMLKFIDGSFIIDKTEPLPDEPLVAIGVVTAWVRWGEDDNGNKRPLEHRVTAAGQIHPDVDDMPDRDEDLWPPGLNGEPADPWKDTRYLHLINPRTGGDLTFVTDSFGGRRGVVAGPYIDVRLKLFAFAWTPSHVSSSGAPVSSKSRQIMTQTPEARRLRPCSRLYARGSRPRQ